MPRRLLLVAVVVALVTAACGDSRPSLAEWQPGWDRVSQGMPTRAAFVGGPDEELCADALVIVRDANDDVIPTPDEVLDGAVEAWLEQAREIFQECPPRGAVEGFDDAYDRLDALRAEVEAGVARTN